MKTAALSQSPSKSGVPVDLRESRSIQSGEDGERFGRLQSGFYRWKKQPQSKRQKENTFLLGKIRDIYHEGRKKYGSPRITNQLRKMGQQVSQKRVARLMKDNNIVAKRRLESSLARC